MTRFSSIFLLEMGIKLEEFGDNDFVLKTIPNILGKNIDENLVIDIIDTIDKNRNKGKEYIEEKIIRMSCRKSIKAGDELTTIQMKELYDDLMRCKNPYTCPHGRPTMIRLTLDDLEKKFKRT
jgi:DNA mismatch repair protein MutL